MAPRTASPAAAESDSDGDAPPPPLVPSPAKEEASGPIDGHSGLDKYDRRPRKPAHSSGGWPLGVPPSVSLPLLNLVDMLAVSLVVPLLHQYYRSAGVTSARQREFLSSLFSSSQIAGGLVLGGLTDAGYLSRRTVLFVSFAGSAVSYGLIVRGGFRELVASRVVVGLVKQTMTVTTALMARHTTVEERPAHMGRLSASTTVAWIVGPSAGALLYEHAGPSAPAICASFLFVLNSIVASTLLPKDEGEDETAVAAAAGEGKGKGKDSPPAGAASSAKFAAFASNLKSCFTSSSLGSVVLSLLLFSWVTRSTSYASMSSYYEEMYGLAPHQRGYVSSYQQLLNLAVQSALVRPLLKLAGGERRAAVAGAALLASATALELLWPDFRLFVCVVCPMVAVAVSMLGLSLRSLVTTVAPKESLGSVLAALDVLQSAANVTTPFYRAFLFSIMARYSRDDDAAMKGDPNPIVWLSSSVMHWVLTATILGYLLLGKRIQPSALGGRKEKEI